ncbi:MAG: chemotaxis protein CheW [Candidatus Competibacterales bacterium]
MEADQPRLHPFELLLALDQRSRGRLAQSDEADEGVVIAGRLALRLGTWHLMFAMGEIAEIIPMPKISRVPGVKAWLLGIANLRGTVISIVDLNRFLGRAGSVITPSTRVVVVRQAEWSYGLLVDEIVGMRHFGYENRHVDLREAEDKLRPYLTDVLDAEGKLWMVFSLSRFLDDPRFMEAAE